MRIRILFIFLLSFIFSYQSHSQVVERFPKPDFQGQYVRPELHAEHPDSEIFEYLDVLVLIAALSLASYLVLKKRSRRYIFFLILFSTAYFGFYKEGCICAIGAVQNISYALFNTEYAIPITVILFFALPLIFTLFFGRTFCAAVCPLGAVQDLVIMKPVNVPKWLAQVLGLFPYIYLGLAVIFAATGAGFIICQYDPFVGFFRFSATFNMLIFGASLLVLGTVVARPYCRFLCPYGVLLNWMSLLSRKHASITPDECNNCRLCEASCPVGAIEKPQEIQTSKQKKTDIKRMAVLLVLLPIVTVSSGWVISRLNIQLSKQHFTVSLADQVRSENNEVNNELTEEIKAFRASGKTKEVLFEEARTIQDQFRMGGWLLGGFAGFIFCIKLINFSRQKRRDEFEIDRGLCISCARCFEYCPYEQVRLGLITPEEVVKLKKD